MDTIFALSTILGRSGVAVIRISGPKSLSVVQTFIKRNLEPRHATFCTLYSPFTGEIIDKIIAIYFQSPNSFTGEDVVELHLHGSIAIVKDLLKELGQIDGTRLAEPGEFTKQAFENGKMDLIEVEALADLIHSETTLQRRTAINQISGHLTNLYQSWRQSIIEIMAQFEAYIDFPDDDIPYEAINHGLATIEKLIVEIENHLTISEKASSIVSGLSIAIAGPPNVGKSSIMNLLSKEEASIVSDIAGTTRDIVQVNMEIGGVGVTIYDTAGIRENTLDLIEAEGIKRAKAAIERADIKLYVFDISNLGEMKNFTIEDDAIVILNKSDLVENAGDFPSTFIPFSAKTSVNLDKILDRILSIVNEKSSITTDGVFTTQQRQKEKLQDVLLYLKSIDLTDPLDVTAEKIRSALVSLQYITGTITLDEVLDKIFSSFCIGK
jgi:tRNA modification GTPase